MKKLFCGLGIVLFLLGRNGSAVLEAKKINPHREQKYCLECHIKRGYAELKKSSFELCAGCHKDIITAGLHPLEGLHNRSTSTVTGLPLREGKIVCITCHEPCTRTVQGEPDGKTEHYGLLRKEASDLCLTCHLK